MSGKAVAPEKVAQRDRVEGKSPITSSKPWSMHPRLISKTDELWVPPILMILMS